MVVFDPVKLVIKNYTGEGEWLESENNPEDPAAGTRKIKFGRVLLIEQDDFMENPPKKYFRLAPGQMVRLKSAYIIRCEEVIKDVSGKVAELHCSYIPESRSGNDSSGISVKGTLHWVNAADAIEIEVREYDRLFRVENPTNEDGDFKEYINPESLKVVTGFAEPSLRYVTLEQRFQFLRKGYYCPDREVADGKMIFNRTVGLKDGWKKA
jgi:glutaminyl-tRNA synthetase